MRKRLLNIIHFIGKILKPILGPKIIIEMRAIKNYFFFEREILLLKHLCDKNKTAVDVGAEVGLYTYFLRKYSKHVYAFEPNPKLVKLLKNTFDSRVTIYECALSDFIGQTDLLIPINDKYRGRTTMELANKLELETKKIKVQVKALDKFHFDYVSIIKIDVEGYEMNVLKGAINTIKKNWPTILIEVEERHRKNSVIDVFNFMNNFDYKAFFFLDGKLYSIKYFEIDKHQNIENIDNIGNKICYINNFIFIKRDNLIERLSKYFFING